MTTTTPFQNLNFADHELPNGIDSEKIVVRNLSESKRAASFRILRHKVTQKDGLQSLLVTSPTQSCGKSFVALNLALALSEQSKRPTLLMEANAPHQSLASLLRFEPPECLLEQCNKNKNTTSPEWNLVDLKGFNLHIAALSVNQKHYWPTMDLFTSALDDLKTKGYEHIVIDGGQVLNSANANLIQEHVDGVLMVVKAKSSKESDIIEAAKQLGDEKILGSTLVD